MPLDPLRIFAPGGPIPLPILNFLVRTTAAALPGAAAAGPAGEAALRLYVQHAIASCNPGDGHEAMLAATVILLQAQVAEMFRIADAPTTADALKRRHHALGASIGRTLDQGERRLERARKLRLKEEETPSERSGYWFRDASVPGPPPPPLPEATAEDSQKPMHQNAPAPDVTAPAAARQFNPMPSEPKAAPQPNAPAIAAAPAVAAAPAIAAAPARPAPGQPLPSFAAPPSHPARAEAAPRLGARLLDPGEPKAIRAMAEAAAKDAIARALRSPPPGRT